MARYKFQFWLNGDKDNELLVAETIDELKTRRSFSAVVRDGIMIVNELRQGRVDLLLTLYPWVKDAIADMLPPPEPPPTPPINQDELLVEFRRMLMEYNPGINPPPVDYPLMKGLSKGMGGHAIAFTPPADDDDENTIVLHKGVSTDNSRNFMAGFSKLGN